MTTPPATVEFIAHYPVLAVPLALMAYLMLLWAGVRTSRELLYAIAAAPGLVNLWAWIYFWDVPGWAGWVGFLQGSALLNPTNILAPALSIVAATSLLYRKLRERPPSEISKCDLIVLALIAIAYCYDQVIITGVQTP